MERVIIKKYGRERIEVSISEFKGRKFLDIRNYYYDADNDEWKPTPKGVSVPAELAKQVYRAVKLVGSDFFDLLPPNGKEQEADDAINRKKAKKAQAEIAESGVQRRKKKSVDADVAEAKTLKKKKKKKVVLPEETEKPKLKSKKKKDKAKASATASSESFHRAKRPTDDDDEPVEKKAKKKKKLKGKKAK